MRYISRLLALCAFALVFALPAAAQDAIAIQGRGLAAQTIASAGICNASATQASVHACLARAAANPGRALIVMVPPSPIPFTSSETIYPNTTIQCVRPNVTSNNGGTSISDSIGLSTIAAGQGTVFKGDGTFPAFIANNTPLNNTTNYATTWITHVGIKDCGFYNFSLAWDIGATNSPGPAFGLFENNIISTMSTAGYRVVNTTETWLMHNSVNTYNSLAPCGIIEGDIPTGAYQPGNIKGWTDFCSNPGFNWEIINTPGTPNLGVIDSFGLQAHNAWTPTTQTVTPSNGSPDWPVTDLTKWPLYSEVLANASADGLLTNTHYVVTSRSGSSGSGTVQLSDYIGSTIVPGGAQSPVKTSTGTTGISLTDYGFPDLLITGGGQHSNDQFTGLDMEGQGVAVRAEGIISSNFSFTGLPGPGASGRIVVRAPSGTLAGFNTYENVNNNVTWDSNATGIDQCIGQVKTVVKTGCMGVSYNNTRNTGTLTLNQVEQGQGDFGYSFGILGHLEPIQAGGGFAKPVNSTNRWGNGNCASSANGYGGVITFTGTTIGCVITLPTITSTTTGNNNMLGYNYEFVNSGSAGATLVITTDGTQVFNGVAAKTTETVAIGQVLDCYAGFGISSALQWNCILGGL